MSVFSDLIYVSILGILPLSFMIYYLRLPDDTKTTVLQLMNPLNRKEGPYLRRALGRGLKGYKPKPSQLPYKDINDNAIDNDYYEDYEDEDDKDSEETFESIRKKRMATRKIGGRKRKTTRKNNHNK